MNERKIDDERTLERQDETEQMEKNRCESGKDSEAAEDCYSVHLVCAKWRVFSSFLISLTRISYFVILSIS